MRRLDEVSQQTIHYCQVTASRVAMRVTATTRGKFAGPLRETCARWYDALL